MLHIYRVWAKIVTAYYRGFYSSYGKFHMIYIHTKGQNRKQSETERYFAIDFEFV